MTIVQAKVLEVFTDFTGDVLVGAHAAATTLQLNDASDFSDSGGQLEVVKEDNTVLTRTYTARDTVLDTVTVTAAVTAGDGDRVRILPRSEEKWAHCQIDESMDMVKARIPHSLARLFPVDIRALDEQESVLIVQEETDWVVSNIMAKESSEIRLYSGSQNELESAVIRSEVSDPTFIEAAGQLLVIGPQIHASDPPVIQLIEREFGDTEIALTADQFSLHGIMSLGPIFLKSMDAGVFTGNTDANSRVTVAHSIGVVPDVILLTPKTNHILKWFSTGSASFDVEVANRNGSGGVGAGVSTTLGWLAILLGP